MSEEWPYDELYHLHDSSKCEYCQAALRFAEQVAKDIDHKIMVMYGR